MVARAHQSAIWSRQRQVNALRSALREYYPAALAAFGTDLAAGDAVAVLALAPTPDAGRALSQAKIASALAPRGPAAQHRQRASEIQAALRGDTCKAPPAITRAHGAAARSAIRLITAHTAEIAELEAALSEHFEQHPDAKIVRSLPGLGTVLGARVLGEFGDDRTRFTSPKSRKNYAGTSPITRASGRSHIVLARYARNRRLADALDQWAFCSLTQSPRRPRLLRPAPRPRQDPPPGAAPARQPLGRHPPHLPPARPALRRNRRLAAPESRRCLTSSSRGMSSRLASPRGTAGRPSADRGPLSSRTRGRPAAASRPGRPAGPRRRRWFRRRGPDHCSSVPRSNSARTAAWLCSISLVAVSRVTVPWRASCRR